MFAVTVTFTLVTGSGPKFLALVTKNAAASRETEPGCLRFDVCTDPARPDTVFLYELYTDAAAFDAHRETAHFHVFDGAIGNMVAKKEVHTWDEVVA